MFASLSNIRSASLTVLVLGIAMASCQTDSVQPVLEILEALLHLKLKIRQRSIR